MFWGGPKAPSGQLFGCLGDIYFEVASFFCADMIDTGAELGFSNLFFTFNHPVPLLALSFFFMVLYQIHHVLLGTVTILIFPLDVTIPIKSIQQKMLYTFHPVLPPSPQKKGWQNTTSRFHRCASTLRRSSRSFHRLSRNDFRRPGCELDRIHEQRHGWQPFVDLAFQRTHSTEGHEGKEKDY